MKIEINKPLSQEVQQLIRRNTTVSEIKEVAKMYGISEAVFQHLFYDNKGRYKVSNNIIAEAVRELLFWVISRLKYDVKLLIRCYETIQPNP